jgi:hypothetical protein
MFRAFSGSPKDGFEGSRELQCPQIVLNTDDKKDPPETTAKQEKMGETPSKTGTTPKTS